MSTGTLITADEFLDLNFEGRYDLVRGELVEMATADIVHGFVCAAIVSLLRSWSKERQAGRVGSNDGAIRTERDPDTVRGADVYFFSNDRLPKDQTRRGLQETPPNLVVEVFSPSNRWTEMLEKVGEYLAAGVDEVWVVDPESRTCQIFRGDREPTKYVQSDTITSNVLPGFSSTLAAFFEDL